MKSYRNLRNWITLAAAIAALLFIGWVVFEVFAGNSGADIYSMQETEYLQSENKIAVIEAVETGVFDSPKLVLLEYSP